LLVKREREKQGVGWASPTKGRGVRIGPVAVGEGGIREKIF